LQQRSRGAISVYAQGDDYHDLIKKRLKALARWLVATSGGEVKVFVDTAAVMEKPLAQAAGLGWQGKHTNLVSREFGSWLFLGAIFTTLDLPRDAADGDHCGSCQACLDICPTAAFPAPYQLDARRCISYLTIEHHGVIPEELRSAIGNRIFGCDDCQLVCPWNKFARVAAEPDFRVRHGLDAPDLVELFRWTEAEYEARSAGSALRRLGFRRWLRNIAVALGNAPRSVAAAVALAARRDDADPLVREHVRWALARQEADFAKPATD
jgi:epoxyqueuosine reductase